MRFLDPTTDLTFKKIFGDKTKKDILIAFLNDVIDRKKGERIRDIIMVDPNNHPEAPSAKYSIVDIKCVDERGITYIVEMQVINQVEFLDRAQYYASVEVARQLGKSDRYTKLTPVIFVGVANFVLFENDRYISHHKLLDTETYENKLRLTEYHFLELSKFKKTIDELDSIIDQWAYFLKNASKVDEIPALLQENKEIMRAFEVLKTTNFSRSELASYDKLIDAYRLERSRMENSFAEGMEKGEKLGEEKKSIEIAQKLLQEKMPLVKISSITGLSIANLKKIKKDEEDDL